MTRIAKSLEIWCRENGMEYLLEEWDEGKNSISMSHDRVEYNTPLAAHWKCKEGHEWHCSIVAGWSQ